MGGPRTLDRDAKLWAPLGYSDPCHRASPVGTLEAVPWKVLGEMLARGTGAVRPGCPRHQLSVTRLLAPELSPREDVIPGDPARMDSRTGQRRIAQREPGPLAGSAPDTGCAPLCHLRSQRPTTFLCVLGAGPFS